MPKGTIAVPTGAPEEPGQEAQALSEDEMLCPSCRTVISKDAIMCYACGNRIREDDGAQATEDAPVSEDEMPCPNCKTMISKDAIMCYACGANIKDTIAKQEVAKAEPESSESAAAVKRPQIFVKKIVKKKTV
jgi:predicted amidophosphoribosyltransferase